jgi:hypothetical protein
MTHRALLVVCLTPFALASLACMQSETAVPPTPEPTVREEADDEGFGALFDQDQAPAPRPTGDTAEPAAAPVADIAPAAAPAAATTAPSPRDVAQAQAPATPGSTAASEPEPATGGYKAIVAFYGGEQPEDFASTVASLRSAASAQGIQVILAPVGSDTVSVDGGRVNIGAFRAARDAGFVFAADGRQSVFAYYPPETPIRTSASGYFGVSL